VNCELLLANCMEMKLVIGVLQSNASSLFAFLGYGYLRSQGSMWWIWYTPEILLLNSVNVIQNAEVFHPWKI
jgi:hypothetical protein